MRRGVALIVAASTALILVGCGSGDGSSSGSGSRPSSTAGLKILEPQPGAIVSNGDVVVRLELTGGTITSQVSTNLKPDEGHVHLKLDGRTITLLGGLQETLHDVTPGLHVLEAEFVASDHGPFDPRVLTTVTFTAQ
jgi:hypothetical protein